MLGRLALVLMFFSAVQQVRGQESVRPVPERCGNAAVFTRIQRQGGAAFSRFMEQERVISNHLRNRAGQRRMAEELIRIPVVVHVVHHSADGTIGGASNSNISDQQIVSQIAVLNEDFRRREGTPGFNTHPAGADSRIEFYLAEFDPGGKLTNGITRTYSSRSEFNVEQTSDLEALAALVSWPVDQYLNIWVTTLPPNLLGYANFPAVVGIGGLSPGSGRIPAYDGVFIDYRYFGRKTGTVDHALYDLGRTLTHETGHWLGLLHTWGLEESVNCNTDYCDDTPPVQRSNNDVSDCRERYSTCGGVRTRNMTENFMDYSPDRCMNIFTNDQVARMHAVLELSPARQKLVEYSRMPRLQSSDRLLVELSPNPIENHEIKAVVRFSDYQDFKAELFDQLGNRLNTYYFSNSWSKLIRLPAVGYAPGVYIFRVTTGFGESVSQRLLIYR